MAWLIMLFALVVGAVAQALLPTWPVLGQARTPVLLGLVLYYALNHEGNRMLVAAFVAGLFHDAMSQIPLGYSSLWYTLTGLIASRLKGAVLTESALTQFVFGSVASAAFTLGCYVLLRQAGQIRPGIATVVLRTFGSAVLGFICVPAVCFLVSRMERGIGAVEVKKDLADGLE